MSEDSSKTRLKKSDSKPAAKWSWVSALTISILSFVLAQVFVAILVITLDWDINSLSLVETYTVGIMSVLFPLAGIILYLSKINAVPQDIGIGKRPRPFVKPLGKAFGLYILSAMAVVLLLSVLAPSVNLDQTQDLGLGNSPGVWYEYVMLGLLLVVLTPISEEIMFRGFMLKGLASRFGWTAAAIATSLLFGLAHGQLNVAIDTAILGWFSAQLVINTKSLWPSIALHSFKNSIAFILVYMAPLV